MRKVNTGKSKKNKVKTITPKIGDDSANFYNGVIPVLLFSISILLFFLILIPGENVWSGMHMFVLGLFGKSAMILPIIMIYITVLYAKGKSREKVETKIWLMCFVMLFFCSAMYTFSQQYLINEGANYFYRLSRLYTDGTANIGSGFFSGLIGIPLVFWMGITGARIINIILLFITLMLLTGTSLMELFRLISKPIDAIKSNTSVEKNKRNNSINDSKYKKIDIPVDDDFYKEIKLPVEQPLSGDKPTYISPKPAEKPKDTTNEQKQDVPLKEKKEIPGYTYPSVELMEESKLIEENDIKKELRTNGQMLVKVLESFNVRTRIVNISRGPSVTRYELQPAPGVKISRITGLSDDIALNLEASGVRIEAPIPGKAAVGIEIPNKLINTVRMRDILSSAKFKDSLSKLTVVLGLDITGNVAVADLAKMPHLLIAGSTGSGKSVCINSFIISLLYKSSPEDVRLLMIDPKVVELGVYNGIPHLLVPVVTDPRKAAGALNWAVNEMLGRYRLFAENNVRDLASYNKLVKKEKIIDESGNDLKALPQIVIIIDELADLMMVAPNEVEDSICRLAQMARAAGMHLVIATQRPSVDIITGIIKANIPSRIALAVSSSIDSRTILDMSGAEKLLGRGDMLFSPVGSQKPIRIQGSFVTDEEIERVIDFIKSCENADYDTNIIDEIDKNSVVSKDSSPKSEDGDEDPMMKEAIKCVVEAGQASTSLLQRRLRLGYARAGRLIDEMEQIGIVGPHEGSKPRQVLINYNQWLEMNMHSDNKE